MEKEFKSLSEEGIEAVDIVSDTVKYADAENIEYFNGYDEVYFNAKSVKEFIRELKEFEASKTMGGNKTDTILISFEDLNKLVGKELV